MKTLKWFSLPLLGVAGIALLLSESAVGDVSRLTGVDWVQVPSAAHRSALMNLVDDFWSGPLNRIDKVCFNRAGDDWYYVVEGTYQLTEAQAWTRLQQGRRVKGSRWLHDQLEGGPLRAGQRNRLGNLVSQIWGGSIDTVMQACWRRKDSGNRGRQMLVQAKVIAVDVITEEEARSIWNSGQDIIPVAVVQ